MKLSEVEDYLQYGVCLARKDYQGALQALERCLAMPEVKQDLPKYADLTQRLGAVYFSLGEKDMAIDYFNASETIDPSSLLAPYLYAKFLAEKLKDFHAAIQKCDAIIARATDQPFPQSEDDLASEWYVQKANELKAFCIKLSDMGTESN